MASLGTHYTLCGGWWPTKGVHYVAPVDRLPEDRLRFQDLVDHLSRQILHRPAGDRLLKACCNAVGCQAPRVDRRGPRRGGVGHAPAAHHLPRLPRLHEQVTQTMTQQDCCPEFADAEPARPVPRRPRRRRLDDRLRLRRRHRLAGLGRVQRPRCSWCCRCAGRATASAWSSRTRTRRTTPRGPTSPSPPRRCWPRTACSACTRSSSRCCRSGPPARWPRCTRPACRRRTARTSPRWRRSRTPHPGSSVRSGWLNRLIGTDADANPLQGLNLAGGVAPASLYGPQPVMSAPAASAAWRIAGDDDWDTEHRRVRVAAHALGRQHLRARPGDEVDVRRGRRLPARQGHPRRAGQRRRVPRVRPRPRARRGRARHQGRRRRRRAHRRPGRLGHAHRHRHRRVGARCVQNAGDLARSLAAFLTDLGPWADKVTVVTISEFGRRVQENASGGTDHGYGNVMFLAGAGRQGRHVLRHVARPLQHPRRRPARDHGLPQRAVGDRRQPLRRQPRRRLPRLRPQSRRSDARRLSRSVAARSG